MIYDGGQSAFDELLRRSWHPVAVAEELTSGPLSVRLLAQPLVLVRTDDGSVSCFTDVCVHRGAALSLGWIDDGCLRCPFHGWRYEPADGRCVEIPSMPSGPIPRKAQLTTHRCVEHVGLIWVALDDPIVPLPEFPEYDDERFRVVVCPPYDWNCNASRRLENFLDFAHFAWVHPGTLGDRDFPQVPAHDIERVGDEIRIRQPRPEPRNDSVKTGGLGESDHTDDGRVMTVMQYRAYPPLAAQLRQELPDDREYAVFLAASPLDHVTTRTFWHVARTYAFDQPDEEFVQFQVDVVAQDRPIVESQRPEEIPAEVTAELHVTDDKVSLAWRRLLTELVKRAAAT